MNWHGPRRPVTLRGRAWTAAGVGMLALAALLSACRPAPVQDRSPPPIVGAWLVRIPEAPFPQHLFVFHADGTVVQSNPDAGDPRSSDSNLMGAWRAAPGGVAGKLVEVTAERATHQLAGRLELSFELSVRGDEFTGTASAMAFDAAGEPRGEPVRATLNGRRILP